MLIHPSSIAEHRVPAALRQLHRKQRRESRRIRTKSSISMPDVIAKILVLQRVDHRRVGIFRCAWGMRSRIVEEFPQKARERGKVFGSHCAGFEDHQAAIVQEIAQRGTKLVIQRLSIKLES